jgi:predicted CopG family antitoxin
MITTIQLNDDVKKALNRMKETGKETYEEIIVKMMQTIEEEKRNQTKLLIEGCKEMANESLKIAKEWEGALMDGLNKNEKW